MNYLSDDAKEALTMLANKGESKYTYWRSLDCICFICNKAIIGRLSDHGLMHLKERGLIAFI